MKYTKFGNTGLEVSPIIFGTSCLGNLYEALPYSTKLEILQQIFQHMEGPVVLDSAGKYGAGLALEVIGQGLRDLEIPPERVIISNKLGWVRKELTTPEPTFEPGAWADLEFDAVQRISYHGIMECWEQGCELLGEQYQPSLVSVHDPDEYLAQAQTPAERNRLYDDILGAYQALVELKEKGLVKGVGIGAKDWRVIREIDKDVKFDWVMFACSYTIYYHPPQVVEFMDDLADRAVGIVNSAVFHSGFLTGGKYFDYRVLDESNPNDRPYFEWRKKFFDICKDFKVKPADACVQFGLLHRGINSIALNTGKPKRIKDNINSVTASMPPGFWDSLKEAGLLESDLDLGYTEASTDDSIIENQP